MPLRARPTRLGGSGGIGALIGLLTLAVAVSAAVYARNAAEHTKTGAEEARRSADAAEAAVWHARHVARAELRPWAVYDGVVWRLAEDHETLRVQMAFKNLGRSPAVGFALSFAARPTWSGEPVPMFLVPPAPDERSILAPGGEALTRKHVISGEMPISLILIGRMWVWLHGYARYEDPGDPGVVHETEIIIRMVCSRFETPIGEPPRIEFDFNHVGTQTRMT
jgi:hypothetical protein